MKYYFLIMILMLGFVSYGQDKILEAYNTYEFTKVDWFYDLADHLALKDILSDEYSESLDSIIFTGADPSLPQFKRSYFMDDKTEIQASWLWQDGWQPSFFRKYKYGGNGGLLSEYSIHFGWDGSTQDWNQAASFNVVYSYDDNDNLKSIDSGDNLEVFTYEDNRIVEISYFSFLDNDTLVNTRRTVLNYDDEKLNYASKFLNHQGDWIPHDSIAYTYNQDGDISKRDFFAFYFWVDDLDFFRQSYEYHYHTSGVLDKIYHYEKFDSITNAFVNVRITEYDHLVEDEVETFQNWFIFDDGEKDEFPFKEDSYTFDRNLPYTEMRYPRNLLFEEMVRSHNHKILLARGYDGLDGAEWPPIELGKYFSTYYYSDIISTTTQSVVEEIGFDIFPNPAKDYVNITSSKALIPDCFTLELYDVGARNVKQIEINHSVNLIDISNLDEGLYYYKISCGDSVFTGSLVKVK